LPCRWSLRFVLVPIGEIWSEQRLFESPSVRFWIIWMLKKPGAGKAHPTVTRDY
jgi:hypothetical protein